MPAFLRLIRFAKMATLVAGILTIFEAVLVVSLQVVVFLREGSWHALTVSSVFDNTKTGRGGIYVPASVGEVEKNHQTDVVDALLQVPVIVPLLLAAALLTAFYLWLTHTEKRSSGN